MTLLILALIAAAPERVVVVAKKTEPPGFFARLAGPLGRAFHRLYEREDDDVARGNALAAGDDPEGALREYDKARARLADDPGVAYDRSAVLLKLNPSKAAEAASEASAALQRGDASLKPKAAYHLALAAESMGHADEAVRQYASALALDPSDVDSKVNLELLLRTKEERRQNPVGEPKENQPKQQGGEQKPDAQKGDASQKQQSRPQDQGPAQQQKGEAQDQAQPKSEPKADEPQPQQPASQRAANDKPVDRSEAQRLLDALRASEKNLQSWRFAKKKADVRKRGDAEKDW
jgi:tetratricopeptide (TPR) repeat protein